MIVLDEKKNCTGCNACVATCPQQCISTKIDEEGFWYPEINKSGCIECNRCENMCPVLNKKRDVFDRYKIPFVYGAYNTNQEIRIDSTSGGIFSALAEEIFDNDGYIGGAIYKEDHTVVHILTADRSMLPAIRSSKYLQSYIGELYSDIDRVLQSGKKALICAAPCQIAGLYAYLGHDYDNLITCDFICLGVNSPKVFKKYMDMLEKRYHSKASKIKFKDKTFGWHRFSIKVDFDSGKSYCKDRYHDPFFIGYLQAKNFARPSCYACQFKNMPRQSDITLADFWGIEKIDRSMDQDLGTSLVLVNSNKGKLIIDSLGNKIIKKEYDLSEAVSENFAVNASIESMAGGDRKLFFNDLEKYSFDIVSKKHFPLPGLKNTFKKNIKRLKSASGLLVEMGFSITSWIQFLYYNFFSRKIMKSNLIGIFPLKYCRLQLDKSAKLLLNGRLILGIKQVFSSHMETRLLIERNGRLEIKEGFSMYAGSYIRVIKNGCLIIDSGFINENVQITCASTITIGKKCTIARDVIVRDYDGHSILSQNNEIAKPIKIGNHVWIGNRAMILKGVTIGDGAVIAAGAIVTRDVPENCIAAGCPARVIRENISWA
jgi:acetyltransferase-like isoleucine patch superfamily enzyme/coenzyme F420-reducing hydrogenase beta subunit